ncbi:MAG TPA: hypothetical protein VJZ27_14410 [Aggregatilineales bacterium]|nr:hypothetical protein [Aggregatilineales bacterium]
MNAICGSLLIIALVLMPFALYALFRRAKLSGGLIVREEYEMQPDGRLRAEHALFNPSAQILELHEVGGVRRIPFSDLRGIQIQVRTSRKIHISLILENQSGALPLSIVTNHDLKLAGINAHRVAQVVAEDGEGFLKAFREHQWSQVLIGATFEYMFQG